MLHVALTGNIASGKSTVAEEWRRLGATLIDSDVLSREAVIPGSAGLARISDRWGAVVINPDGELDRAALRDIVFGDEEARRELEAITHPEILKLRQREMAAARERGDALVIADIPLLFELNLQNEFDSVVVVDSPRELRLRRLMEIRGLDREVAIRMIDAQSPSDPKVQAADFVIPNSGTIDELILRARDVLTELRTLAGEGA